jgi:hypothetical protein
MAWKIVLSDVHGHEKPREMHALAVRFVGDAAEVQKTDGTYELFSLNRWQLTSWTREALWSELRKLNGGRFWFEPRAPMSAG